MVIVTFSIYSFFSNGDCHQSSIMRLIEEKFVYHWLWENSAQKQRVISVRFKIIHASLNHWHLLLITGAKSQFIKRVPKNITLDPWWQKSVHQLNSVDTLWHVYVTNKKQRRNWWLAWKIQNVPNDSPKYWGIEG